MNNITLKTPIHTLEVSEQFITSWDKLVKNYLNINKNNTFKFMINVVSYWKKYEEKKTLYDILDCLQVIKNLSEAKKGEEKSILKQDIDNTLNELKKEGIDFLKIIEKEIDSENECNLPPVIDVYIYLLKKENKKIPLPVFNAYLDQIKINSKFESINYVSKSIKEYFHIMEVLPQELLTYPMFKKNLEIFTTKQKNYVEQIPYEYISYDYQALLYDYIEKNHPEKIEENILYYPFIKEQLVESKNYYQKELSLNLYKIMKENNFSSEQTLNTLNTVIKAVACKTIKTDFLNLVDKTIEVNNIHFVYNSPVLKIQYSSPDISSLDKMEDIILKCISAVAPLTNHLSVYEIDNEDQEFDIVLSNEELNSLYLEKKLNESLKSKNDKPKMKI